jgi:hypothetical protein
MEILGAIELPRRYKESYRKGFLERLLTEVEDEKELNIDSSPPDKMDVSIELS